MDLPELLCAALECDLLLAIGSTLTVSAACDLVPVAAAAGARVVIVNAQPTRSTAWPTRSSVSRSASPRPPSWRPEPRGGNVDLRGRV